MKQDLGLSDSASAADCVAAMQNSNDYDYYNDQDAFDIALVRYNMEAQEFSLMNQYTFASNISIDMVVQVSELSSTFPGVTLPRSRSAPTPTTPWAAALSATSVPCTQRTMQC